MRYLQVIFVGIYLFVGGCVKTHLSVAQQSELDQKAIVEITKALVALPVSSKIIYTDQKGVEAEAALVAKALVNQTRETDKEFQMTGGPKWHNFLIKLGVRKKGYCYHWVPELLKALPTHPLKFFERHWGGSFQSLGRENNAVIITKRGAPLQTGIVYDAWRGVGKPFWLTVAKDKKYPWTERFNETEILNGEAKVEPK
ncbi:MAG: hypothetical protein A2W61_00615 [Deltaproteobacteria bacterium RIFCSPLOWO2_01_44_7]|nr:MAG: hypothetical protein A2712_08830 [Deltaproteobacteria bacterium RIFCSPHIGHO2_01_FULL_43_49]OGQ14559.1 MAG: hypothetical protein A3D22_08170 [Deltaproteobacteria bacterium RIFCSPHIGHO2_02_FULL_44_53]OGQ27945.1 MAG: hypothetical protein A3D98_06880 [Deltaproteobacteria bacterium RIFCSPHIGHO2_12_FULL_44_21]OGQ31157.1 MAG: hypothetical protein A2979_06930 [Deltaproteobacteria bacterium RIFCSPLOWO2_01_FULL_45_74]OGQ37579.1 MAG: hypothetical protein A2W61_00615 [Deltaproteobacteria bacterium 